MGLLGSMKERLNRKKVQPKDVECVANQEEVSLKRNDV